MKKQIRRKDINTLQWQNAKHIGLLLHMVISVNQLSIYGAVADMIVELPFGQRAPGNNWVSATNGHESCQDCRTSSLSRLDHVKNTVQCLARHS